MESGEVIFLWAVVFIPIILVVALIIGAILYHDHVWRYKHPVKPIHMPSESLIVTDSPFIDLTVSTDERFPRQ